VRRYIQAPAARVLAAGAVSAVVLTATVAILVRLVVHRLPRVPDRVVSPIERALPTRLDAQITNPTDDWYYRYVAVDVPAAASAKTIEHCASILRTRGWAMTVATSNAFGRLDRYEVTVADAQDFARTAESNERTMLERHHALLDQPGCVLIFSP
jgi:hypothetical protein